MELTEVLIKPIITEKSLNQTGQGWYTFMVAEKAVKNEIKRAVEKMFKVNVLVVKTLINKGKAVKSGKKRTVKKQSNWKKAFVKLAKEQKIDLFSKETK